ncbi:uncharacterized protein LACBIDRAFT_327539 [Laccaria bicolor S238N-H82]|uniref:Predicted protein n=1 Tax=Laccaria bicolor (strain S238N-H82 / ATCC MYA-4686) TaxID=486041 RepID=B0DC23_LACBS|nr:uncharacterized protein LACBIDRAFT_327539 [Laccaria bicolor S238N-H82]EDR07818.1 predicted protein [Laccaria bicolor S238N-H82]|eukprot:XP_001881607.1 predicted protein [Laccaria bicolor S238N-H82]
MTTPAGLLTAQPFFQLFLAFFRLWPMDVFNPDQFPHFLDDRVRKYITPNPFIFLPFNASSRTLGATDLLVDYPATTYTQPNAEIGGLQIPWFGYFFNTSWIRPFLWVPAELTSLMGGFFLLKRHAASSPIFDALFKGLVFLGAGSKSEEKMALTFIKFFDIYGRKFGGHFMNLARRVLGLEHILLDCAGSLCHVLCLGIEPEDDIDLESQAHADSVPSYD